MVRDYWEAETVALLRTSVSVFIFSFLGRFLAYQYYGFTAEPIGWPHYQYQKPTSDHDSTVFVPIACFLDPDLDPLRGLTDMQKGQLGGRQSSKSQPEIYEYGLVTFFFLAGHAAHLARLLRGSWRYIDEESQHNNHRRNNRNNPRLYILHWIILGFRIVSLGACITVYIISWWHMGLLREWVHSSGWITGGNGGENPERNATSIGQLIPIMSLI
ncbi:hypothetical protein F5Y19DRAFT_471955 [Xylariaceae sp. FL1651]|nr:hypothetical protein F5Y19DRAFT_471955 [Xylariaceae sp. FL1651]